MKEERLRQEGKEKEREDSNNSGDPLGRRLRARSRSFLPQTHRTRIYSAVQSPLQEQQASTKVLCHLLETTPNPWE
ncbi:hypothetical protein Pcinc_025898 [Petrolisthes cinctipes]|uniref:Uncharacterized protein n=1 Tax=Petrolisthes cinctipes TaxID=88211 RepID=A0AAE1F8B7_PETCI|nr:hypothetical protein Pcinc_025898 [Petrolisthes cinctipes]